MAATEVKFVFEGMPVGVFEGHDGPRSPGLYRYIPFRSFNHYQMHTLLRAGGLPRCHYEINGVRVSFTVTACPEYGVLELCDSESSPHASA